MSDSTAAQWLMYTQLLDSALPVGAFAHSFGLETMVQQGRLSTVDDLQSYMELMLFYNWSTSDALGIKAVYEYARTGQWDDIWLVDQMLDLQRGARETREGMRKMGKRLYQLCLALYPEWQWQPLQEALHRNQCSGALPIIHGYVCYLLNISLSRAVEGYLYTNVVNGINSALRLMSMGQTEGQKLTARLLPLIPQAWKRVHALDPMELHTLTPAAEIHMMRHEGLYSRLFMS